MWGFFAFICHEHKSFIHSFIQWTLIAHLTSARYYLRDAKMSKSIALLPSLEPLAGYFLRVISEHCATYHWHNRGRNCSEEADINFYNFVCLWVTGLLWIHYIYVYILIYVYIYIHTYIYFGASLIVHLVKNPPAMQETPVWFLGWEDLLEKG